MSITQQCAYVCMSDSPVCMYVCMYKRSGIFLKVGSKKLPGNVANTIISGTVFASAFLVGDGALGLWQKLGLMVIGISSPERFQPIFPFKYSAGKSYLHLYNKYPDVPHVGIYQAVTKQKLFLFINKYDIYGGLWAATTCKIIVWNERRKRASNFVDQIIPNLAEGALFPT